MYGCLVIYCIVRGFGDLGLVWLCVDLWVFKIDLDRDIESFLKDILWWMRFCFMMWWC